jgi:hypothetical protein
MSAETLLSVRMSSIDKVQKEKVHSAIYEVLRLYKNAILSVVYSVSVSVCIPDDAQGANVAYILLLLEEVRAIINYFINIYATHRVLSHDT